MPHHMNENACVQYIHISLNTFHMPFICFFMLFHHAFMELDWSRNPGGLWKNHFSTPRRRQRSLSLPSRVAARLNMKCQNFKSYLSFHIIPSRCISSSVVSCYVHVSSSFWCHLMFLRTPLRTLFYVSSCVVSATLCFLLSCLSTNFNHDKFWKNSSFFNTRSVHLVRWVLERRSSASRRWWASCSGCLAKSFKELLVSHLRTNFGENLAPADDVLIDIM